MINHIYRNIICIVCLVFVLSIRIGPATADPYSLYSVNQGNELVTLDLSTSNVQVNSIGSMGFDGVNSLAYDKTSNTLFGVDNSTGQLVKIDRLSGSGTSIGSIGLGGSAAPDYFGHGVYDLTFGPNNTLYGLTNGQGSTGRLISIDTTTGEGVLISDTPFGQHSALAYQSQTDKMYSANRFGFGSFYEMDPSTGVPTLINAEPDKFSSLAEDPNSQSLFGILNLTSAVKTIAKIEPLVSSDIGPTISSAVNLSGLETVPLKQDFLLGFNSLADVFAPLEQSFATNVEEAVQQAQALMDAILKAEILTIDTPTFFFEPTVLDALKAEQVILEAIFCVVPPHIACLPFFADAISIIVEQNSFQVNPDFQLFDISLDFQIDPEHAPLFEAGNSYLANLPFLSYGDPYSIITIDSLVDNGSFYSVGISIQGLNQVQPAFPEPTTIALLGIGLAGLAGGAVRRRLKKTKQ